MILAAPNEDGEANNDPFMETPGNEMAPATSDGSGSVRADMIPIPKGLQAFVFKHWVIFLGLSIIGVGHFVWRQYHAA